MSASPSFFPPLVPHTAADLAEALGLPFEGDETTARTVTLTGVAPLDAAGAGDLSFLDNRRYANQLPGTGATCVVLAARDAAALPAGTVGLVSAQPYRDFARAAALLVPASVRLRGATLEEGISPMAFVHPEARLERGVTVEAGAAVGAGAAIGSGSIICAGAVIGHDCQVGRDTYIGPRASIQHALVGDRCIIHAGACIGQDGFGFAMGPSGHLKVPQLGRVIIQNDVEIGAATCIDRGTTRDTVVGEGTRIDNQVQIGHNVEIGRHCVMAGQVGIAGSTRLADFVALGGQAGLGGHLSVGMGAQIAACASVMNDVPAGARWAGAPARPARQLFREIAILEQLAKNRGSPA